MSEQKCRDDCRCQCDQTLCGCHDHRHSTPEITTTETDLKNLINRGR